MALDIVNGIMDAIIDYFPVYLNEGLLPDDPDYLETIEKGPLQDDPTQRATFLIIEPDMDAHENGYRVPVGMQRMNDMRMTNTAPMYEVGGGYLMMNFFRVGGWTPLQTTKTSCYEIAGKFARRLERSIQQMAHNELFEGITTDDEGETTGGLMQMFNLNGLKFKLVGGESEWYGKVYVHFCVYSRVENNYWR
jgi:hypothetical protein